MGAPTAADRAAAPSARPGPIDQQRSLVLPAIVPVVSIDRGGDDHHPARDADAMSSRGFPLLLALEVPEPGRSATHRCKSAGADPADEHRELALGCTARFATSSPLSRLIPVRLPPGRARLATRPSLTGFSAAKNTMGMPVVAALAADAEIAPVATITATRRRTRSAVSAGRRPT
jgi:hypothetical protein